MKVQILDAVALRAISPAALAAYARDKGWEKTQVYGDHADVYVSDGKPEIVLPRTSRLADYASVVSRLIGIFSEINGRDELATYRDLAGADHDVVRIHTAGADDDGSVPLDAGVASQPKPGVELFGGVHQLKRDQHEVDGLVTFKADIDDKTQSVSAVLDQNNYSVAIRAHAARNPVVVTGDLERIGQRWRLTNASVREVAVGSAEGEAEEEQV